MSRREHVKTEDLSFLHRLERRLSFATSADFETEKGRRWARWNYRWMDHGILRKYWTNLAEIAPGVWRSNHPDRARLERYRAMGIRTVFSLRGHGKTSPFVFEAEDCQALGLTLIIGRLHSAAMVSREEMLHVLDVFDTIERPFVMHCKSGADRAGLASAMWKMHIEGQSVAEARDQLSFKYLHIRKSRTGILDYLLDAIERDLAATPMPLRQWIETRYDPRKLTDEFRQARKEGRA